MSLYIVMAEQGLSDVIVLNKAIFTIITIALWEENVLLSSSEQIATLFLEPSGFDLILNKSLYIFF